MVNIGLVGCGYWGKKYLRVLGDLSEGRLTAVCDADPVLLEKTLAGKPRLLATTSYDDLLSSNIDAVVIATPAVTHFPLARKALEQGKHVLVEKPFTVTSKESVELIRLAEEQQLTLMVGATFLYSQPVRMLKQLITAGDLGQVLYVHSSRLNFGLLRPDVDVLWDLAPHDLSILLYLLDSEPVAVGTRGVSCVNPRISEVAYADLLFGNDVYAHLHLSWLEPQKVRRLTVVGSERMVIYDDLAGNEAIRLYDRRVSPVYENGNGNGHASSNGRSNGNGAAPMQQFNYHLGDVRLPYVKDAEPLHEEVSHFVYSIRNGARPLSDGLHGLQVVRILEALTRSLEQGGAMECLTPTKDDGREPLMVSVNILPEVAIEH